MKKDKLYTVTKGNKQPISRGISKNNLFSIGGLKAEAQAYKSANPWDFVDDKGLIDQYINTDAYWDTKGGLFNMTRRNNPFSRGNLQPGGMGASLLGAAGAAVNQGALKLIGGDYETGGIGEGVAAVGNTVGGIVGQFNPVAGAIVQGATGVIGGGINRTFGIATNEENLAKANTAIATGKNYRNTANSYDMFKTGPSFASVGRVYKGGLLRKGDGNRKDAAIHNDINDAIAFIDRSDKNTLTNIGTNNINTQLANYSAYGGPLDRLVNNDMGAIEYGFMSDFLDNQRDKIKNQNKMPGISPAADNLFCGGGKMFGKGGCLCNKFGEGGDIEIKHPGRLTELKKRTGKTEAELWAEGKPEVRKMITFARNSRKWSKAMGGQLHKDGVTVPDNVFCGGGKLFPYGGGTFSGSGAGGSWDDPTDTYPEVTNFNEAFDKAVAEGLPEFLFQGRRYNTQKENNPVREYNNRWVGQGRKANVKNPSKAYDRQAGPLGGPLAAIPMVTNTYIGSPERPPMLDFNPYAMERGKMLPYSWSNIVDRPKTVRALGGDIQNNGADFTTGLTHISAGGSHEENPNEGVQVGVDQEGTPNLVEENETIFNDYVYSDRIELDDESKNAFHIGKKKKITYAAMSKRLEKEASERPNDPISQAALKMQLQDLAEHQERQKAEMEQKRVKDAFDALTPEEQANLMQYAGQQQQTEEAAMQEQAMAKQQAMAEQQMAMQQPMQEVPQEAMPQEQMAIPADGNVSAYGGPVNKYSSGSKLLRRPNGNPVGIDERTGELIDQVTGERGTGVIPEVVVTGSAPIKVSKDPAITPFEAMSMYNNVQNEREKEELVDMMKEQYEENRRGPKIHYYPYGGPFDLEDFLNTIDVYKGSLNKGNKNGFYAPDAAFDLGKYGSVEELQNSEDYKKFTDYVTNIMKSLKGRRFHFDDNDNIAFLDDKPLSDEQKWLADYILKTYERRAEGSRKDDVLKYDKNKGEFYFDDDAVNNYIRLRNDNKLGVYHLNPKMRMGSPADVLQNQEKQLYIHDDNSLSVTPERIEGSLGEGNLRPYRGTVTNDMSYDEILNTVGDYKPVRPGTPVALDNQGPNQRIIGMSKIGQTAPFDVASGSDEFGNKSIISTPIPADGTGNSSNTAGGITPTSGKNSSINGKSTPTDWTVKPVYRDENLRYAGLLGPAVGLGMMAAGIGKPDKGQFDAILNTYDGTGARYADYKPLGNYLTYRPMDLWAEQNRMNANARATDRALMNNSAPVGTRAAGLLANAYNNQVASGQLYRQGLEYNNNLNERVQTFNRQTDQYNADAYNRVSLANADIANRDRQYRAQLAMQGAAQKADMDAGWYNSLYGNVSGIFKGLSDLGRENAQHNMIADMAASGLFGRIDPDRVYIGNKYLTKTPDYRGKKCGGKLNRKKGGK